MDVEKAFLRIKNRVDNNRYDAMSIDFHNKVRRGFLEIAKQNNNRIIIIDANCTKEQIFQKIIAKL